MSEDDNFYSSMYSDDDEDKDPAKDYQILSGMKLAGSTIQTISIGQHQFQIPNPKYVQVLESQLRDARKRIKQLEGSIDRMSNRLMKLESAVKNQPSQAWKSDDGHYY